MATNGNANAVPFIRNSNLSRKRIMDSLVCWYDIGKQQCTNESMAANPVLADLSGNGHDIECFNFGWSGMSGIGGYVFQPLDQWYKSSVNNGTFTTEGYTLHITKLNTSATYYLNNTEGRYYLESIEGNTITTKSFNIRISGLPDGKTVYIEGLLSKPSDPDSNIITQRQTFNQDGQYRVSSIEASVTSEDSLSEYQIHYPKIYIPNVSGASDDVDITIEILPLYPNALVSDGVDDYCYTDGLPILTDYTVIAKRKWVQTENDYSDCFAAKGNILGSFLIERNGNSGSQEAYSFGQYNEVSFVQEDIIYQTKESYNGYPLKVGTATDVDNLVILGRTSKPLGCIQAALYSFLLFDRTLTTAEIEWVKKNMIESGEVLATNWADSSLWAFYNEANQVRITRTLSSNRMTISSSGMTNPDISVTSNFMECIVQNSIVPAYKIKVTGLKNGIILYYVDNQAYNPIRLEMSEDGIYEIPEHNAENRYYGFSFNKTFENENIVIQQLLS